MSNLMKRTVSALFLAPLFLYIIYLGELPFAILTVILIWLVWFEINKMRPSKVESHYFFDALIPAFVTVGLAGVYLSRTYFAVAIPFFVMMVSVTDLLKAHISVVKIQQTTIWRVFASAYLSLLLFWIPLRQSHRGLELFILSLICVWANDIGAYFVGSAVGYRKLAPVISPNKTYTGAVSGLFVGALVGCVFALVYSQPIFSYVVLGIILAVAAQIGDLFASMLKRAGGVKDSGNLIPGHGGVVDRIDGVLFAMPTLFVLINSGII